MIVTAADIIDVIVIGSSIVTIQQRIQLCQ